MHSKLISKFKFGNQSAAEKTKSIFYITCSMAEPLCRKPASTDPWIVSVTVFAPTQQSQTLIAVDANRLVGNFGATGRPLLRD